MFHWHFTDAILRKTRFIRRLMLANGPAYRMLDIIGEYTRGVLMIRLERNSVVVVDGLSNPFILRGPHAYIRSDNGPEFRAIKVREWIEAVGAKTACIEPGSPRENGYLSQRL
ncbi:hypothetical protein J5474_21745 [Sagittula sp. M10.9X]|uniref:Integrase catalytic domain-containing protein n=1 Tax=Sagittula salina TaxID=2820268 RepID=A0A940MUH0_9RHOB|nr:hypothetical protein [Sagittula salina]